MNEKVEVLRKGAQSLQAVLAPHGFNFEIRGSGNSSGGTFAWGEFVRENRRLELHFRNSLGLVRYHIADQSASHETYMRELGAWADCRYPGFSDDAMDAFRDLAHDITIAEDFIFGTGEVLRTASEKQARQSAAGDTEFTDKAVGDVEKLDRMRERFRIGNYSDVIEIASTIHYMENVPPAIQKMIEIAKKRLADGGLVSSD